MRALSKMLENIPKHSAFCDQGFLTRYKAQHEDLVQLDYNSDVFRSLTAGSYSKDIEGFASCGPNNNCGPLETEVHVVRVRYDLGIQALEEEKLVKEDCVGNIYPASIHGNGGTGPRVLDKVLSVFKEKLIKMDNF